MKINSTSRAKFFTFLSYQFFPDNVTMRYVMRSGNAFAALFLLLLCDASLFAQSVPRETLRGEVSIELEAPYLLPLGISSPVDRATAGLWALEESAAAFSGMIYGWTFEYEPGERARELRERVLLTPLGRVESADPRLKITEAAVRGDLYELWADYELSGDQQYRLRAWNSVESRETAGRGYAPLAGKEGTRERTEIKRAAFEEAVKKALRAQLRGEERNRPRLVRGYIALARFPVYRIFHGNWAADARFRVRVTEIVPFPAY
jgi:hypothetical protein